MNKVIISSIIISGIITGGLFYMLKSIKEEFIKPNVQVTKYERSNYIKTDICNEQE